MSDTTPLTFVTSMANRDKGKSRTHSGEIEFVVMPDDTEPPIDTLKKWTAEHFGPRPYVKFEVLGTSVNGHLRIKVSGLPLKVGKFFAFYHQEDKITPWVAQQFTPPLPARVWNLPVKG